MRKTATVLGAALLASLCGACRSDGGIDRADQMPELQYAWSCVSAQTKDDVKATTANVTGAPAALARSVHNALYDLEQSRHLYLQNTRR